MENWLWLADRGSGAAGPGRDMYLYVARTAYLTAETELSLLELELELEPHICMLSLAPRADKQECGRRFFLQSPRWWRVLRWALGTRGGNHVIPH